MGSIQETAPFRIAIVGGGIGGLFCALSVHHHSRAAGANVEIDVYEQATQYKEIGAGVWVGINSARLVHKLGLGNRLNAIAGQRTGTSLSFRRFDTSEEVVSVPFNDEAIVRQAPCARTELLDMLKAAVEERGAARLHTNKKCQRVEDLGGPAVRVHFADGATADANLVIACDGIHSAVRNQFSVDKPIFSGKIAYRGVVSIEDIKDWPFDSYCGLWLAKHRHALVFPISGSEKLNIVAFVTKGEGEIQDVTESWTSVCDRKDVEKDFEGFDECIQGLIALMPVQPSKWRLNDREPLNRWHYMGGKVILLGDAAHPMLPFLGQGCGQSLEDGWVLGRALSDHLSPTRRVSAVRSLEQTVQLYQTVRLPRAQKTQVVSRVAGDTYELQTEDMADKPLDECLRMLDQRTRERLKRVWEEDLDAAYEQERDGSIHQVRAENVPNGQQIGRTAIASAA